MRIALGIAVGLLVSVPLSPSLAEAQQPAPPGKSGSPLLGQPGASPAPAPANAQAPLSSQATTTQVNSEVIALKTAADLVARDLGFNGAGDITFNLVNRGEVGTHAQNMPGGSMTKARQAPSSSPPISIDVYIGTSKITIQQPSMGGKQTKNFTVPIPSNYSSASTSKPKCLETRNLKVVVDPQNQVKELHDDNNVTEAANSARPCPDLAIKSIKRDYEGLLNETYRVKVTVVNQGNAPSPSNVVWATSLPGGVWPVTGWPELVPTTTLKALAPGEETSFKVGGSVVSANKTAVRIILDRDRVVEESDEGNNFKDDRL